MGSSKGTAVVFLLCSGIKKIHFHRDMGVTRTLKDQWGVDFCSMCRFCVTVFDTPLYIVAPWPFSIIVGLD